MNHPSVTLPVARASKRKLLPLVAMALASVSSAFAHSIDYLASGFGANVRVAGESGNYTVIDPVTPGSTLSFNLAFSINTQGSTARYPITVAFGTNASTSAGLVVTGVPYQYTFLSSASRTSVNVSVAAPTTPGHYRVSIGATSGTGGGSGLSSSNGVTVSFTVHAPTVAPKIATVLTLHPLDPVVYRQPQTTIAAQLLSAAGAAVSGKEIVFEVDGIAAGTATTDSAGVATLAYPAGTLGVGNHLVTAAFAGDDTHLGSATNGLLGVRYIFIGYQQPINADGSSIFSGKVIPVKIVIADYFGGPVATASARVYFAQWSTSTVGTELEASPINFPDSGNSMRYDASANQYIFNWDTSAMTNGTYNLRVDLAEGNVGEPHAVTISLRKKK